MLCVRVSDFREGRDQEKEEFTLVRLLGVGWGDKSTCFANSSSDVQLNMLFASLVSDKKRSVRNPWIYFLPL